MNLNEIEPLLLIASWAGTIGMLGCVLLQRFHIMYMFGLLSFGSAFVRIRFFAGSSNTMSYIFLCINGILFLYCLYQLLQLNNNEKDKSDEGDKNDEAS